MEKELIKEKLIYLKEILFKLNLRLERYVVEDDEINKETLFIAITKLSEEIVEIAIKINNKLLEANKDYASTYYQTFEKLKKYYKIDLNLLKKLAITTSLRNKVTHEYENILIEQKINKFKELSELYTEYIKLINKILKSLDL